jgi:hypothetical protein
MFLKWFPLLRLRKNLSNVQKLSFGKIWLMTGNSIGKAAVFLGYERES